MEIITTDFGKRLLDGLLLVKREVRIFTYVLSFHIFREWRLSTKIYRALCDVKGRGVDIRIIVDAPKRNRPNFNVNNFSVRKLLESGIEVRMPKGHKAGHAKVAIFDNDFAIVGSHNITDSSFSNPFELSLLIKDPVIVAKVKRWFDQIWVLKSEDWGW